MVCASDFPACEGLGFHVWNLARCLRDEEVVADLCTRGSARPYYSQQVERVKILRVPFVPVYPFHLWLHGIALQRVIAAIELNYDLVHFHSPVVPALHLRIPIVATFHSSLRYDVKHTRVNGWHSLLVKLQGPFSYWHEERLLARADVVTAVSAQVASALKDYRARPSDLRVVPNAVCLGSFPPHFGPRRVGCFLWAGRISPGKGIEDLLAVAERLPKITFQIAGAGPMMENLRHRSQHLKNVEWLGHIASREKMSILYQEASALLVTSHFEGSPSVVLEAMASGCPVIATAAGGIPEIVEDGITGKLVRTGDVNDWEHSIRKFSPVQAQGRTVEARRKVERFYSWQSAVGQYLQIYREVLSRQGERS